MAMGFPTRDSVVRYFETVAERINAPIECGVEVTQATRRSVDGGFDIETSEGSLSADNIVVATGPFRTPIIRPLFQMG